MIIDTEKRLQHLENEIKALKSTYTISAGAMKTYLSYSDTYIINDILTESPFILKFTSDYGVEQDILISSFLIEETSSGTNYNLSEYAITLEQNGDGTVTFEIPLILSVDTIRVAIASTVPGTFARM